MFIVYITINTKAAEKGQQGCACMHQRSTKNTYSINRGLYPKTYRASTVPVSEAVFQANTLVLKRAVEREGLW